MSTPKAGNRTERVTSRSPLGRLRGVLACLLLAKIALAAGWLAGGTTALARGDAPIEPSTMKASLHPALEPVPVTSAPLPAPSNQREARALLESLARRQAQLVVRERELSAREDRVGLYEKDLTEKIARLETLQKEISRESHDLDQADSEAAADLAKVYAAMKPSEAAPLLDRLDDKTVLRILAHMRAKQIGELLPLLDRDKAIVLTQALAAGN